ncbi:hypothetical protein [Salinibacterium sp. TMP30]|uniref:hypothetical protein n=1 Tax=Salinibacterium sp. TMP30 TaxID=3138237 RepID=UPI00313A0CF7
MTTLNALLLVANDAEAVERLESQFATAGLAEVIAAAAECDVVLTIATLDPVKHAEKTYARNAIIHSLLANPAPLVDRLLLAVGAQKLRPTLAKSPVGRLINSLSATDPSRTFARAYSRKPAKLAGHFDLVIASDTAAIRTAWLLNRRHRATAAFFGEAAAIATLRESN